VSSHLDDDNGTELLETLAYRSPRAAKLLRGRDFDGRYLYVMVGASGPYRSDW